MIDALTTQQKAILEFEATWLRHGGAKEEAIRREFNLSAPRYYQLLGRLARQPQAVAFDPLVTARVRATAATRAPLL